jgi:hypothetical protein
VADRKSPPHRVTRRAEGTALPPMCEAEQQSRVLLVVYKALRLLPLVFRDGGIDLYRDYYDTWSFDYLDIQAGLLPALRGW